jgi:cob(I)alamin adenosyltransferase
MSISTKTGDAGKTGLAGGLRISKADLRVECYGTVDELGTFLGFARSICPQPDVAQWTESIQRTLFRVGSSISTPPEGRHAAPGVTEADVASLTTLVNEIEATEGILSDWSLPGANTHSAAYEMARTVCRRAERLVVRLHESGSEANSETGTEQAAPSLTPVPLEVIAYLNRLSDLIWLFGRLIEVRAGVDARLRDESNPGPGFSKAW